MLSPKLAFLWVFVILVEISYSIEGDLLPLIKLAELQAENCDEASFCALRILDEVSPDQNKACCNTCSCEADCLAQGTCCPDYQLLDLTGRNISKTISEYSDLLSSVNFSSVELDHSQLKCVETSMKKFKRINFRSKVAYSMINSCSFAYNGSMITAKKCENPKDIETLEYDLFFPVTSMVSRTTYSNIYCLLCNEELNTTGVVYWSAAIYCESHGIALNLVSPHDFFQTLLKKGTVSFCRLVFQPSEEGIANKCGVYDEETCPEDSDKLLSKLCKSFHLPVTYLKKPYQALRYRNIACFLCNMNSTFLPKCKIPEKLSLHGYELNINRDGDNNVVHDKQEGLLNLNFDAFKRENSACERGFIQNTSSVGKPQCIKVFCPWHFYINDGKCVPTFTRLNDMMFTAPLEVRRAEMFEQAMLDEIRYIYLQQISKIGTNIFHQFNYSLWEVNNDFDVLIIFFNMEPGNYRYKTIMQLYALFLDRACILSVNAKSSVVEVSTFQTRSAKYSYKYINIFKPKPKEIYNYGEPLPSVEKFRVEIDHLCYRVAIPLSNSISHKDVIDAYYSFQFNSKEMLVCVDDIHKSSTNVTSAFFYGGMCAQATADFVKRKENKRLSKNTNNNKNVNNNGNKKKINAIVLNVDQKVGIDDEGWSDLSKGLLICGVVVAVIIFILVLVMKNRKESDEDTEEASDQDSQDE